MEILHGKTKFEILSKGCFENHSQINIRGKRDSSGIFHKIYRNQRGRENF